MGQGGKVLLSGGAEQCHGWDLVMSGGGTW